jgi:hypothetical protein
MDGERLELARPISPSRRLRAAAHLASPTTSRRRRGTLARGDCAAFLQRLQDDGAV